MDKNDQLFMQLISLFQSTAWQGLGKIKNPVTDKVEVNIEQARHAIDMLEMLKEKTKGNLAEELNKLMESILTNLRLNYVAEANKPSKKENKDEGVKKEKKDEK